MSDYIEAITSIDEEKEVLVFETEGYVVDGDKNWKDIFVETEFVYKGGKIGISPRVYETNMYMYVELENTQISDPDVDPIVYKGSATIGVQVTYDRNLLAAKDIPGLVIDQHYVLKAKITKTNYKIYLDDTVIFNIEYSGMPRGSVGAFASSGNELVRMEVQSSFPDAWETNVDEISGAICSTEEDNASNKFIYLKNSKADKELFIEQEIDVKENKDRTISFLFKGDGLVKVLELDGEDPKEYSLPIISDEWKQESLTYQVSAGCTKVKIGFYTSLSELRVNDVQDEEKSFRTSYIHNTDAELEAKRANSIITYPSKNNISTSRGTISMWVNPAVIYQDTEMKPVLFEYGSEVNSYQIGYEDNQFYFNHVNSDNKAAIEKEFNKDEWYHIVSTWGDGHVSIYVNNEKISVDQVGFLTTDSNIIRIGHGEREGSVFNGIIDETIVYGQVLSDDEIKALYDAANPVVDNKSMLMRATFNHALGSFNRSIIEATMAPKYGSPIIIEKEDGTSMQKVSFFDYYTGEYRTFNDERVVYDGFSDFIRISYDDLDLENFRPVVCDEQGVLYGDPLEVKGNKVYMKLTDKEKEKLKDEVLIVSYQIDNAFTVDFNIGVPDSFRINIGKHDGQDMKIYYEGNDFHQEKLATMVELNPLLNPNHKGFLYVTGNIEPVTSFRIKATPSDLPANGASESLVLVEPLDLYGNFISHARLEVSCEKGSIIPAYDLNSIKLRDRAGRYIYKYRAPILKAEKEKQLQVKDKINVKDKESGIGVQLTVTLKTLEVERHLIVKEDNMYDIAHKYGASVADIAVENEMTAGQLENYIKENVGSYIKIPINYSSSDVKRAASDLAEEIMIGYIITKMVEYKDLPISKIPEGLGEILDVNNDGLINDLEFLWIQEKRFTKEISDLYSRLNKWFEENKG
ncbi:structural protein [Bacillus phage vB_BauM_KLEB27-3]|nr:structural protein [Bacillus phage vB_BauM_KLEB27-3]